MIRASALAAAALLLAGCYRVAAPPALGETVRVQVTVNDARLVRAQASLQTAVARALEQRLGWRVSPAGSARLELTLAEEAIGSTATDRRDVPARWTIRLQGAAQLRSARGTLNTLYDGTGHASGRMDEAEALDEAAANAALQITTWLETTLQER